MAPLRLFIPGLSHHVRHRGNNRCVVFRDTEDREMFLAMLRKSSQEHEVGIHAYVLMTTHYHAQVTAPDAQALPRMMQSLGRKYVRYFNTRHRRTGTLWEGRYRASLIFDDRYWLTCLRYIEVNPVRAGLVASPADYQWSSHRSNAYGDDDSLLTQHALYLQLGRNARDRAAHWAVMCGETISERELAHIREATHRGYALTPEYDEVERASRRTELASSSGSNCEHAFQPQP